MVILTIKDLDVWKVGDKVMILNKIKRYRTENFGVCSGIPIVREMINNAGNIFVIKKISLEQKGGEDKIKEVFLKIGGEEYYFPPILLKKV